MQKRRKRMITQSVNPRVVEAFSHCCAKRWIGSSGYTDSPTALQASAALDLSMKLSSSVNSSHEYLLTRYT